MSLRPASRPKEVLRARPSVPRGVVASSRLQQKTGADAAGPEEVVDALRKSLSEIEASAVRLGEEAASPSGLASEAIASAKASVVWTASRGGRRQGKKAFAVNTCRDRATAGLSVSRAFVTLGFERFVFAELKGAYRLHVEALRALAMKRFATTLQKLATEAMQREGEPDFHGFSK